MRIVKFSDVVNRVNEFVDKDNTDLEFYIGKGGSIEPDALEAYPIARIKDSTIGYKFHFGFQPGHILFMSRSFDQHKAATATFAGICSDSTYVVETKDETILLQSYLQVVMQSQNFWDWLWNHKTGGVNYLINYKTLAQYEFPLPSIKEQKQISQKVWAAYRLKESYKRLLTATDEMVKSQFIEMFGGCPMVKLEDEIKTTSGGTPNTKKQEYYDGGNIPWLSSGEINQGYIYSTEKYITQKGLDNSSAKWIPQSSVLIAMYGATAGKVGFTTIPLTTNQAVCALLPCNSFDPLFLYYAVLEKSDWMISQCRGAAQPNISQSIIRSMKLPKPSFEQQKQFVAIAEQADKSKYYIQKQYNNIRYGIL